MSPETLSRRSFLGLEGQHVFITGAAGAIGGEAVREFLGRCLIVVCFVCNYLPYPSIFGLPLVAARERV